MTDDISLRKIEFRKWKFFRRLPLKRARRIADNGMKRRSFFFFAFVENLPWQYLKVGRLDLVFLEQYIIGAAPFA